MTNPITYNNSEFKDIICQYAQEVYKTCPPNLQSKISDLITTACNVTPSGAYEWTLLDPPSRQPWTIDQVLSIIQDPWFTWNMKNDCNIKPLFLNDIFGENNFTTPAQNLNPVVAQNDYPFDKQNFILAMAGINHYLFGRTYYIDLCYGTSKYIELYYGTAQNFLDQLGWDYESYVDSANGLLKGNLLRNAWRTNEFRNYLYTQPNGITNFIKSLFGVSCSDFFNWNNSETAWWINTFNWDGLWLDNLSISTVVSENSVDMYSTGLIQYKNSSNQLQQFPGYRISVHDLYGLINQPEADTLAALFGESGLKGPYDKLVIPSVYDINCYIPPPATPTPTPTITETPTLTPTITETPTPTPTPTPTSQVCGFPVSFVLSDFGGYAENCNNYNGTYTINEPFINGEPAVYNYPIDPINNYVLSNSVDVGYSPNNDTVYVCLNSVTPDGSYQVCQYYSVDWSTGNYAIAFGGGFPYTPWCTGNISLTFSNCPSPTPTPTPSQSVVYECSQCYPEPNCNGYNFVRMNWSGSFCNQGDYAPNGLITDPLDLVFLYNGWSYSTPTAFGYIYCDNGQWKFEYTNSSVDGTVSVSGILGNVNPADPCNIIGLSSTGTITYNIMTGIDEYCTGEEPISLSVGNYPCPE